MPTENTTGQATTETGSADAATLLYTDAPAGDKPAVEGQAVDDLSKPAAVRAEEDAAKAAAKPEDDKSKAGEVEYKFEMPEGMAADEESVAAFTEIAKEFNLPPEKAQAAATLAANLVQKALDGQVAAFKATTDAWAAETKADKEIGGANLATTIGHAGVALDKFFDADTRQLFESSGLGNHKGFIKALASIGKSISGDVVVTGKAAAPSRDAAEILYGKK